VESQRRVALNYFQDGSVDAACPPLKALLHIMAHGDYQGLRVDDPKIRALFTRDAMLESSWYRERLLAKQDRDVKLWRRHLSALEVYRSTARTMVPLQQFDIESLLATARAEMTRVGSPAYLGELVGTIGADPLHLQISDAE
jgi:hypothetical protein